MNEKERMMQLVFDKLQMRENKREDGSPAMPTISGYAIRFNEDSVKMWDYMIERIDPSCVTDAVLKESDIKMTLFHNREMLLARCNKGEGSMRLSVDKKGLKFEFEPADDVYGRMCVEHVQRGDLSGCSFTFIPSSDPKDIDIKRLDENTVQVTHKHFERLLELTIGTDPAYPTTSVESSAREFVEGMKAEQEKLVKDAKEKAEKEQRQKRQRAMILMGID